MPDDGSDLHSGVADNSTGELFTVLCYFECASKYHGHAAFIKSYLFYTRLFNGCFQAASELLHCIALEGRQKVYGLNHVTAFFFCDCHAELIRTVFKDGASSRLASKPAT